MRQQPDTRVLKPRSTRPGGGQEHNSQGSVFRYSPSQFVRHVKLMLSRCSRAVECFRPAKNIVQVSFQRVPAGRQSLIFVDVNLERVLCLGGRNKAKQQKRTPHCKPRCAKNNPLTVRSSPSAGRPFATLLGCGTTRPTHERRIDQDVDC